MKRYLVVDDNADVREALCEFISAWDVRCEGAANGREALLRLRQAPKPVLVLLDLDMPVMTGWELLQYVAADAELRRVPIAVLSAVANFGEGDLCGRPSFTKPIDERDLRLLVDAALGLRATGWEPSGQDLSRRPERKADVGVHDVDYTPHRRIAGARGR